MNATGHLSPEARAWGIEAMLTRFEGRWFEEQLRAQPSEDAAVRWAQANSPGGGFRHPDGHAYDYNYLEIRVRYPDGSDGILIWRDVVRAARAGATQLALF